MKNFYLTTLLLLITFFGFSQGAYTSQNSKKANWEAASAWTKQFSWMPTGGPGPANVGGSYTANVYGYITRHGNLTFSDDARLNVYDTLVIRGNFTISSSQGVVVHPDGVLIILGDLTSTSSGGNKLYNNGNVVATGNFSHSGGFFTTSDQVYSFDTTPTFGWGAFIDGVPYLGFNTNSMGNRLSTKADLNAANPSLGGFVNSLLGVLPIKLISFSGTTENSVVSLRWVTAKEEGFDHFEIERASGDLVFEKIAQVNGTGYNTDDEHAYSITGATALIGTNYYRLKSVDLDGSFEYSSIVSMVVEASESITVYPNPSNGEFVNVSANFELDENTQVTIFNQEGVMLQRTKITECEARIDFTHHLSSGVYILTYSSASYLETVRLFVK
jgi:hypothetical protein